MRSTVLRVAIAIAPDHEATACDAMLKRRFISQPALDIETLRKSIDGHAWRLSSPIGKSVTPWKTPNAIPAHSTLTQNSRLQPTLKLIQARIAS